LGMPAVQDHKRAYEGDIGPNTGGMGSYSEKGYFLPFMTEKDYKEGLEIMKQTLSAVKEDTGIAYKGFLYGQFILTADGIRLIEFNARLGDPEAMNVLSILKTDFVDVLQGIVDGNLGEKEIEFENKATVCKYLVPEGYPDNPAKGSEIHVDEGGVKDSGALMYYASVDEKDGKLLTSGSRSIGLVGIADSITEAEKIAESATIFVRGPVIHRKDIGTERLIQKKLEHMRELRG